MQRIAAAHRISAPTNVFEGTFLDLIVFSPLGKLITLCQLYTISPAFSI